MEKALARPVRLDPLAINDKLRDCPFTGSAHNLFGSAGGGLDVNFFVGNTVLLQKALGHPAIGAPER